MKLFTKAISFALLLVAFCHTGNAETCCGGCCYYSPGDCAWGLGDLYSCSLIPFCKVVSSGCAWGDYCKCDSYGPGGDPHIKKWNGVNYNFHGACDLVVTRSKTFKKGQGFELHMRTTIKDHYSYIESAALRIGKSTLEVNADHEFLIDGTELSKDDLPIKFSDYTLGSGFEIYASTAYKLDLENGAFVQFRLYKDAISVSLNGYPEDFGDVVGLMGDYTGNQFGRDGETFIHDHDDFGAEWQVRPGQDPILFQESRAPQWPQSCDMPVASQRHLRSDPSLVKRAEEVCAHKDPEDIDFCVEDVLATKDEGMAGAW